MVTEADLDKELDQSVARRQYQTPPPAPVPNVSPPPSVPSFSGMGQMGEMMQFFVSMEMWKTQMMANERTREAQMYNRIREEVMSQQVVEDPHDRFMVEAFREILTEWRNSRNQPPMIQQTPQTSSNTTQQTLMPQTASNAVDPMADKQAWADDAADKIYQHYHDKVIAVQKGEIDEASALQLLKMNGANDEQATLILASIMETDFPDSLVREEKKAAEKKEEVPNV
jgi:hypothetical protein